MPIRSHGQKTIDFPNILKMCLAAWNTTIQIHYLYIIIYIVHQKICKNLQSEHF